MGSHIFLIEKQVYKKKKKKQPVTADVFLSEYKGQNNSVY